MELILQSGEHHRDILQQKDDYTTSLQKRDESMKVNLNVIMCLMVLITLAVIIEYNFIQQSTYLST